MLPIRDENPTQHIPWVTYGLIALNVASWALLQRLGTRPALTHSILEFGLIPGELLGTVDAGTRVQAGPGLVYTVSATPNWLSPVTSMFMHGGWFHLLANLWFLGIFGDNIEEAMGPIRFALFYLVAGLLAAAAQTALMPASVVPMVGASGAISGVMGAYALLFPRIRVDMLVFLGFLVTVISVPAALMLGYWFVLQLISGLTAGDIGVAVWAHAGGFLAGLVLVKVFTSNDRLREIYRRLPARG